jgi:hypothetical protein
VENQEKFISDSVPHFLPGYMDVVNPHCMIDSSEISYNDISAAYDEGELFRR